MIFLKPGAKCFFLSTQATGLSEETTQLLSPLVAGLSDEEEDEGEDEEGGEEEEALDIES